jgi:arginine exporter protein ArgO
MLTIRVFTFGFALFFTAVVAIGYVPAFVTQAEDERLLFGLFELSLIDDVTHGVTALAAFIASVRSRQLCLLFLTAFGFYYALDATFFLTFGLFNDRTWLQDIALNAPHVAISSAMLWMVYWWAPRRN